MLKKGEEVAQPVSAITSTTRTPTNSSPQADLAKGDKKAAAAILTDYEKMGGRDPAALKQLASLEEGSGRAERSGRHARSHQLHLPDETKICIASSAICGSRRTITRARSANTPPCVALHPLDKASAQFNLAQAYFAAGQKDKAEDNVLAALEAAPDFRPAQKLLLAARRLREREMNRWPLPLKSIWTPRN